MPHSGSRDEERTLTELYDLDWRETSFVPAGDNPEAKILMWKDLTDEEIEEVLADVERSTMSTKLEKKQAAFAKIDAAAREGLPDLYRESQSRARTEIARTRTDLREAYERAQRS